MADGGEEDINKINNNINNNINNLRRGVDDCL